MRTINSAFDSFRIKKAFSFLIHKGVGYLPSGPESWINVSFQSPVSPLQYDRRLYAVRQLMVGIGMRGSVLKVRKYIMSPQHK
jgi:hypothetical protein